MTLINAVAAAAKSPVTVVFFCANPLDISMLMNNDKIGAIFYVGQPSVTIYGIAELLFGEVREHVHSLLSVTEQRVCEHAYSLLFAQINACVNTLTYSCLYRATCV